MYIFVSFYLKLSCIFCKICYSLCVQTYPITRSNGWGAVLICRGSGVVSPDGKGAHDTSTLLQTGRRGCVAQSSYVAYTHITMGTSGFSNARKSYTHIHLLKINL